MLQRCCYVTSDLRWPVWCVARQHQARLSLLLSTCLLDEESLLCRSSTTKTESLISMPSLTSLWVYMKLDLILKCSALWLSTLQIHCVSNKLHPFYFCNNFVDPGPILIIFGNDTPEENCNKTCIVFQTAPIFCAPTVPCNTSNKSDWHSQW